MTRKAQHTKRSPRGTSGETQLANTSTKHVPYNQTIIITLHGIGHRRYPEPLLLSMTMHHIRTWQSAKKTLAAWPACPVCMAIHIVTSTQSSTVSVDWSDALHVVFRRHVAQASRSWEGCDFPASNESKPVRDCTMCSNLYTCLKVFIKARNSLRWGIDFFSVNLFKQLLPSMIRIGWKKGNTLSSIRLEPTDDILLWLRSSTAHAASRNFVTPTKDSSYEMKVGVHNNRASNASWRVYSKGVGW